jgi:hypothetical protein
MIGIEYLWKKYMLTPVSTYQELRAQYNLLPWYKKVGFCLSAPRLAWGLFGYNKNPSERHIAELIQLAKSSSFYKTLFERAIYSFFTSKNSSRSRATAADHQTPALLGRTFPIQTIYSAYRSEEFPLGKRTLSGKEIDSDVLSVISDFNPKNSSRSRDTAAEDHQTPALLGRAIPIQTIYSAYRSGKLPLRKGTLSGKEIDSDVLSVISDFNPKIVLLNAHAAVSSKKAGGERLRTIKITTALLKAVAYGMESNDPAVNTEIRLLDATFPLKDSSGALVRDKEGKPVIIQLFSPNLYAKSLLKKSPEFLVERGEITDWAGRTFKNITAFEYAFWAKDFKMIEMMLRCIPATPEGDEIRADLFEQSKQVNAPVHAGGGLTYTHTYDCPNLDAAGIPDGTTTTVTENHTESHFDLTPLCAAYRDYETNYYARPVQQHINYWTQFIGKLQRLLPVHILQRYCDPDTSFYPLLPQFNSAFKRSMNFYNWNTYQAKASLFRSSLSDDFALIRSGDVRFMGGERGSKVLGTCSGVLGNFDLAVVRQLDAVSTKKMEKIIQQLSQPQHAAGFHP